MALKDHKQLFCTLAFAILLHVMQWRFFLTAQQPDISSTLFVVAMVVGSYGLRNQYYKNPGHSIPRTIWETIIVLFLSDLVTYLVWEVIGDYIRQCLFAILDATIGAGLRTFSPQICLFAIEVLLHVLKVTIATYAAYKAISMTYIFYSSTDNSESCISIDIRSEERKKRKRQERNIEMARYLLGRKRK